MPVRLFLFRHGLTDWNEQKKYQGQQDIPLNNKGCKQAEKAAKCLSDRDIDLIYSSDLKRARKTAEIINNHHNLNIETKKELREINFGKWQGLTYQEIEEKYPESLKIWNRDPITNSPPAGETLKEFQNRVEKGFNNIIQGVKEGNIIVVSHGGTIKVFLTSLLEMPSENHWQFNISSTGLSIIDFYENNKSVILTLNSVEHLEGIEEFKKYLR